MTARALAAATLAVSLAALIARTVAVALTEIDDALSHYTVENRTPDYMPTACVETLS